MSWGTKINEVKVWLFLQSQNFPYQPQQKQQVCEQMNAALDASDRLLPAKIKKNQKKVLLLISSTTIKAALCMSCLLHHGKCAASDVAFSVCFNEHVCMFSRPEKKKKRALTETACDVFFMIPYQACRYTRQLSDM